MNLKPCEILEPALPSSRRKGAPNERRLGFLSDDIFLLFAILMLIFLAGSIIKFIADLAKSELDAYLPDASRLNSSTTTIPAGGKARHQRQATENISPCDGVNTSFDEPLNEATPPPLPFPVATETTPANYEKLI